MNRFRLREGAMATDDDALYEGCFIIKSPFDRFTVFQVKSSELPDPIDPEQTWEHITVIVKQELMPSKQLVQRKPDHRERDYIMSMFWDEWETVQEFHNRSANKHLDHRIAQYWRHSEGQTVIPEIYREEVPPEVMTKQLEERPLSEWSKEWQENEKRDELARTRSREIVALYDVRQMLELAERTEVGKKMRLTLDERSWQKLRAILDLSK